MRCTDNIFLEFTVYFFFIFSGIEDVRSHGDNRLIEIIQNYVYVYLNILKCIYPGRIGTMKIV